MRTSVRTTIFLFAFAALFSFQQAYALIIIDSPRMVTYNQRWTDDVIIVSGGHLHIDGAILTIAAGYNLTVDVGGDLNAILGGELKMENGDLTITAGSHVFLDSSCGISFEMDGQLSMDASINCIDAFIRGNSPATTANILINDTYTFEGNCTISGMNILVASPTWYIPSISEITLEGYVRIYDPTSSGTHIIDVNGILHFSNADAYINTTPRDRIDGINIQSPGGLSVDYSQIRSIPEITGEILTSITSNESQWLFESGTGISTMGSVMMFNSDFTEYTTSGGWNGIHIFDDNVLAVFDHCILKNTNAYAIWLDDLLGGNAMIAHCTIVNPSITYNGYGIKINGYYERTWCDIECTYINGFERGLFINTMGAAEISDVEITNNTTGCYFDESFYTNIHESSIHDNIQYGIVVLGAYDNFMSQSEVSDNGTYQVYVDAGAITSEFAAEYCNIYSTSAVYPLVYVAGGSLADLTSCYWLVYPPVLGTHLVAVGGSMVTFANAQPTPYSVIGYQICGMVYPKTIAGRNTSVAPSSAQIVIANYPNPFNPSTNIEYTLPEEMHVQLDVHSITGQHITTLVEGMQESGIHTVTFNASSHLSSGVYIYTLRTQSGTSTGCMLLTK